MGEIEVADGAPGVRVLEEGAYRAGPADLGNQDSVCPPEGMGHVFGPAGTLFEQLLVEAVGIVGSVGCEIGEVEDEAGAKAVAVGQQGKQLHPARIDAD